MTQEPTDERQADLDPARHTNRTPLVVLDTNILTSNYLLQTAAGSAVVDLVSRAKGRILLPEVIELELKNVLGRRMAEEAERAAGRMRGLEAIIRREVLTVPDAAELRAAVDQRLSELDPLMLREPLTLEIARAALMRVIEGRPPSGSNNEQFRDCCIWEHCLRLGKSHDVHLVTVDGDFYKDKKPEKGLAEQLRSEVASANASVVAYQTLSKLIEHLALSVPAHDAEALGRSIAELAKDTLGPQADGAGFILNELTQSRVSVSETGRPLNLLATFDLTYSLVHKSEQDAEVRLNPELTASGSCVLSGPERSIRDLQLDASTIGWTDVSGKVVTQRQLYLYARGYSAGTAFGTLGGN
jgi:hypothetical protein